VREHSHLDGQIEVGMTVPRGETVHQTWGPTVGATMPAIQASDLHQRFGLRTVLRDVRFQVCWGEAVALLGANGVGKTTLLRIVAGSLSPSAGRVEIAGLGTAADGGRGATALLAGDSYLYDDLTAVENLAFAARMVGRSAEAEELAGVLAHVGLGRASHGRARFFSSGMRKRLALARVIVLDPEVLLLDEPYASLDHEATSLVDRLVGEWRERGRAVLLATHLEDRAREVCDRILYLSDGSTGEPRPGSTAPAEPRLVEAVP
jgi:heme ABC exporter ATP-binding subunit CcmA